MRFTTISVYPYSMGLDMDNAVLDYIRIAKGGYTVMLWYTRHTKHQACLHVGKDATIGEHDYYGIPLLIQKLWEEVPT